MCRRPVLAVLVHSEAEETHFQRSLKNDPPLPRPRQKAHFLLRQPPEAGGSWSALLDTCGLLQASVVHFPACCGEGSPRHLS